MSIVGGADGRDLLWPTRQYRQVSSRTSSFTAAVEEMRLSTLLLITASWGVGVGFAAAARAMASIAREVKRFILKVIL